MSCCRKVVVNYYVCQKYTGDDASSLFLGTKDGFVGEKVVLRTTRTGVNSLLFALKSVLLSCR